MAAKNWRDNNFSQNITDDSVYTLWVKNFTELAVSRTVSKINVSLHFTQKFNMAVKKGGKSIFGKKLQITLDIPCRSKILSKSLYLTPFAR